MRTVNAGGVESYLLCLGFRRNRGKIPQIVVFASVGDGFQVFRISPVGNADACDLPLLCHGNSLRLGNKGFVRQLVAGDSAAFFYKPNNTLGVGIGLCAWGKQMRNREGIGLIQSPLPADPGGTVGDRRRWRHEKVG